MALRRLAGCAGAAALQAFIHQLAGPPPTWAGSNAQGSSVLAVEAPPPGPSAIFSWGVNSNKQAGSVPSSPRGVQALENLLLALGEGQRIGAAQYAPASRGPRGSSRVPTAWASRPPLQFPQQGRASCSAGKRGRQPDPLWRGWSGSRKIFLQGGQGLPPLPAYAVPPSLRPGGNALGQTLP